MGCAGCAARINTVLSSVPGVENASVSFVSGRASVEFDEGQCSDAILVRAVEDAGYGLVPDDGADDEEEPDADGRHSGMLMRAALAAVLSVVIMLSDIIFGSWSGTVMCLSSAVAVFFCGGSFFSGAWRQLRHGTCSMDTLVALSTGISYLFSLFNLLFPLFWRSRGIEPDLYFESSAMVVTFVLAGRVLEDKVKRQTTSALRKLAGLRPGTVTVFAGGREFQANVSDIVPGDVVLARSGEHIAVDGEILDGETCLDESMLTGESVPVFKKPGFHVFAGTVNVNGSIRYRAESVGEATALSRIVKLVRDAQDSKAPVQELVDKISSVFVPAVLCISVLAFFAWLILKPGDGVVYGLLSAVTVLVIACPCALGLATPTAMAAGIGRGASDGILIKDAGSLQNASGIDVVVLDKTGTLTEGKPAVADVRLADGCGMERVLGELGSLESMSGHPLASAICGYALRNCPSADRIAVSGFEELPGLGVSGTAVFRDGEKVRVNAGSFRYMSQIGVHVAEALKNGSGPISGSEVWLAENGEAVAVVTVADSVKKSAGEGVARLKKMGIDIKMLTGDSGFSAAEVAEALGIEDFSSGVLPGDKAAAVRKLQAAGHRVAMVGDGINDSAALAQADLGIAMGHGSDIAMDSAGMTLADGDLRKVADALSLSRITVRTLKENLFWAFIYNVSGIPVAAGILYPVCGFMISPAVAGLAMTLSSICVIVNSLRVRYEKL